MPGIRTHMCAHLHLLYFRWHGNLFAHLMTSRVWRTIWANGDTLGETPLTSSSLYVARSRLKFVQLAVSLQRGETLVLWCALVRSKKSRLYLSYFEKQTFMLYRKVKLLICQLNKLYPYIVRCAKLLTFIQPSELWNIKTTSIWTLWFEWFLFHSFRTLFWVFLLKKTSI